MRKNVRNLITGISLSMCFVFGSECVIAADDATVMKIATEGTYKPWSFKDSTGKLQGFDVDIANALCEEMKVKCEIVAQEWEGIIPGLQAQRYDAIVASMSTTPARRKQVLFTDKYKNTITSFVAPKGKITDVSPEALAGKRIGVQRGSSQNQWLIANGYDKTASLALYDNTRQPELDIVAGRVDLIIGNKATFASDFFERPESSKFEFIGPDLSGGVLGDGNAIAVRLDDQALCDKFNLAIKTIVDNGKYEVIRKKYFSFPLM